MQQGIDITPRSVSGRIVGNFSVIISLFIFSFIYPFFYLDYFIFPLNFAFIILISFIKGIESLPQTLIF